MARCFRFKIGDSSLYIQDNDANSAYLATRIKAEFAAAQGLTVRHRRLLSLDSLHAQERYRSCLPPLWSECLGRKAGILGVYVGAIGTSMAQQHLRNILAF